MTERVIIERATDRLKRVQQARKRIKEEAKLLREAELRRIAQEPRET